jgi:uncharacterized protein YecE (DUF72 family)
MMSKILRNFFAGLSGLELPVPKYKFPAEYQAASRLTYYSTFFNSLEINSSFYKIPLKATVERWTLAVDNDFRFTFKLFREITHVKNLNFDISHVNQFINTISASTKKGCLLVQFPPGLNCVCVQQLDRLLNTIRLADPDKSWKVAVEFRNRGWYNEDIYHILEAYDSSLVIHDIPASATPLSHFSANTIYVRFHGPTGNYRGSYTDAFLRDYAEYIREWLREGKIVYVYFNNTAGDAFNNLVALNSFVC